ncbi:glycosyltransferase family 2 protein [Lutibacter aestuarii]|uniref:Glycosyltransferase family 2 protein n=1 Tax=Lutibacter aestuarii TaxID=861111 RepID=A0ABW2Z7G1_9FLAO
MTPAVSIIVPNYNHAPFLQQRLESIFNQTFQNFEVILLDDCSTDGSVTILKNYSKHPKVSYFSINAKNSGSTFKQWKKGIALAKGTYIWIAESDDYCEPTFLETLLQFFNEDTTLGLVYCQSVDVNEKGKMVYHRINYTQQFKPNIWNANFTMVGKQFLQNYLIVKNVIPNASAVLFKNEFINKAVFSKDLIAMKLCGDWLFWSKIALKTSVGFVAKELNFFRNHPTISRNHTTLKTQQLRLEEEARLRNILSKSAIYNANSTQQLYTKWFQYFTLKKLFNSKLYKVKNMNTSWLQYIWFFIKYQLIKKGWL